MPTFFGVPAAAVLRGVPAFFGVPPAVLRGVPPAVFWGVPLFFGVPPPDFLGVPSPLLLLALRTCSLLRFFSALTAKVSAWPRLRLPPMASQGEVWANFLLQVAAADVRTQHCLSDHAEYRKCSSIPLKRRYMKIFAFLNLSANHFSHTATGDSFF